MAGQRRKRPARLASLALAAWAALSLAGCPEEPDFRPRDAGVAQDGRVGGGLDQAVRPDAAPGRLDLGPGPDAAPGADARPDLGGPDPDAGRPDARPQPDAAPDAAPPGPALLGDWVSQGADVAPLLAQPPGNLRRLDARFTAGGRFEVTARNADDGLIELVGTYTVDEGQSPPRIVLEQTAPYRATSEGIWQVEGGVLTYEVVETDPGLGASPPRAGFGSTSNGQFGDGNIQIYRRPR